jgi:hypothetical protein
VRVDGVREPRLDSPYRRPLTDPAEIDARLGTGEHHARLRADRTLARTMVAMGL